MSSVAEAPVVIECNVGGVDTHRDVHVAAVLDGVGRVLGTESFPADTGGYEALLGWLRSFGPIDRVGVEGTGSWGKGLARAASAAGLEVREVTRPNRQRRRRHGKTDVVDAVAAAVAVLNGEADAVAKTGDGPAERLRMIQNAREGAVKARTAALNQFHAQLVTSPDQLRAPLREMRRPRAIRAAADLDVTFDPASTTAVAASVLQRIAHRILALDAEIADLDQQRRALLDTFAPPSLRARPGVGDWVAAQLIITVGDNPDRVRSEASFAALCGASCVEASTGNTRRHRLNRGGDRQANRALYTIAMTRMRLDPRTRAYVAKRRSQGKNTKEIIRCLKRYLARELYPDLIVLT